MQTLTKPGTTAPAITAEAFATIYATAYSSVPAPVMAHDIPAAAEVARKVAGMAIVHFHQIIAQMIEHDGEGL